MNLTCRRLLLTPLALLGGPAGAEVGLPFVFTHHMVLQREAPAPVWGKASPGERVTVSFGGQEKAAVAGEDGRWRVDLDPLSVGEPRELKVAGSETAEPVVVRDVLVGEVWVCSGQSNMEWSLENSRDGKLALLAADRPNIRLLDVYQMGSQEPLDDVDMPWRRCTPESAKTFSAIGYFFGVQLQESLGVPIGLIRTAWGGSACEAWVPRGLVEGDTRYADVMAEWEKKEAEADWPAARAEYDGRLAAFYAERQAAYDAGEPTGRAPWVPDSLFHQHRPGNLYNARVAPLVPFAIKGVIWYQGETNAGRSYAYRDLFPTMITAWRDVWGQGDFPFYWVQLADFKAESDQPAQPSGWAELREAQTMTLDRLDHVGEAVTIDLGEANDIHPRNKRDPALRLARLALSQDYGKAVEAGSPRFESMTVEGAEALLTFKDTAGGLKTFDGAPPRGFAVAGEDRRFRAATAEILKDGRIAVRADGVDRPAAVRYGWADNPVVNVYDGAWLPLTPFRTDDWPGVTQPTR